MTDKPRATASNYAWPLGIAAALGIVVSANAYMMWTAIQNPSAPASSDPYLDATNWDAELSARAKSEELNWRVEARPCAADATRCALRLSVIDAAGVPVPGLEVRGGLRRYERDDLDQEVVFQALPEGDGYVAERAPLQQGQWALRLRIEGPNEARWTGTRVMFVQPGPIASAAGGA